MCTDHCKMQHIHSVHPTSRPDLFRKIEIEEKDLPCEEYTITQDKYVRQQSGEKVKKKKIFKFCSVFAVNEDNTRDAVASRKKKTVGLAENEESILPLLISDTENNEDLEELNVDGVRQNNENLTLDEILKNGNNPLLENILNELKKTQHK